MQFSPLSLILADGAQQRHIAAARLDGRVTPERQRRRGLFSLSFGRSAPRDASPRPAVRAIRPA